MGKLLDELLEYLSNATPEQLEKDWEELEPLSHIGPEAEEFIRQRLGKFTFNNLNQINIINNMKNLEYSLDFSF